MKRYDIPTLLGMYHNGQIPLDRFSGSAVDNNLVRLQTRNPDPLSEQPINQLGKVFESPQPTISIPGMQPLPRPTPHTPVSSSRPVLSQGSDGFQQFVKTHSSPKHQRVTAGGRIVPMEPQLAAPEFSLRQASEQETREQEPTDSENTPTQAIHTDPATGNKINTPYATPMDVPELHQQTIDSSDSCQPVHNLGYDVGYVPSCAPLFAPVTPSPGVFLQPNVPVEHRNQQFAYRAELPPQTFYQPVFPDPHVYGVGALGVDAPTWYSNMYPVMGTQGPAAPLPSAIQTYSPVTGVSGLMPGHHHRTFMGHSTAGQYPPCPTPTDTCYVKSANSNPNTPKKIHSVTMNKPPVLTGPSLVEMPGRKSFEEAKKRHDLLSGQLARLDRYTALHSWEIDPESKKLFVQQRMSLVKELDTLRLYREQLDVIYGGLNASALIDKAQIAPIYQTRPRSLRPGKFTSKRAPRVLPLFPSGSHSAGPGWITPGSLAVPTSYQIPESFEQPTLNQSIENASNVAHNTGRKIPSGCESLTESNLLYNEQIRQADLAPHRQSLNAQTINATLPEDSGRGTALQNGTSRLQKLFDKIEAANTRQEPVDGLLRELSIVTAGLINDRSKQGDKTMPQTFGGRVNLNVENINSVHPCKEAQSYVPEKVGGMQHIRRFWESEPSPEMPHKKFRDVSPETDDESNSRPPSSHVSTTDSWTTVHKGDQRYFGRDSLNDEHPGRRFESIWKSRPGDRLHSVDLQTGNIKTHTCDSWTKRSGAKMKPASIIQKPSAPKAVQAKGFMAPFDGAGDTPDHDGAVPEDNGDHEPVQAPQPWYQKKERVKPSYAVVCDFLKRIENEEKNMVYEYRMTGPASWW